MRKGTRRYLAGLISTACLLLTTAAIAATVRTNDLGDVIAVDNLDVGGTLYNVTFNRDTSLGNYGDPPVFTFNGETAVLEAVDALNGALNGEDPIPVWVAETENDRASRVFRVGFGLDSEDGFVRFASVDSVGMTGWDFSRFNDVGDDDAPLFWGNFQVVPVPAALWLFGSALGLLGWIRRRAI